MTTGVKLCLISYGQQLWVHDSTLIHVALWELIVVGIYELMSECVFCKFSFLGNFQLCKLTVE
jgi:hypothetical protein